VRCEVVRRTDDGEPLVARDADGHHVLLDRFAEVDAGIEAGGYELCGSLLRRGHLEEMSGNRRPNDAALARAPSPRPAA
jgi:hypothetical protein